MTSNKQNRIKDIATTARMILEMDRRLNGDDGRVVGQESSKYLNWNSLYLFGVLFLIVGAIVFRLVNLQIVEGYELAQRSQENTIKEITIYPKRGVIFDRDGNKLAENVASQNVYFDIGNLKDETGYVPDDTIKKVSDKLEKIVGDNWLKESKTSDKKYSSIAERMLDIIEVEPYLNQIIVAAGIDNELAIEIKSHSEELPGIIVDDSYQRNYLYGEIFSHILGYTAEVNADDIQDLDYVDVNDTVGRLGVEKVYDRELIGTKGIRYIEVDKLLRPVSDRDVVVQEAVSGENLYLTVDLEAQQKMYEILKDGVEHFGATSGAAIIEDVETGELLVIANYPAYDDNLFIGGIKQSEYDTLLNTPGNPLMDKAIAAQEPPGSTFKTLVASAALDAGAIDLSTIYVSRAGYAFSNGAPFQEYQGHVYGALDVIDALSVSSNIFFCEVIRNWDMNELVPYLEKFGIGDYTGVDLIGEMPGRVPSPANKIALAESTSPWLEPIWYPEGDSCNSVIGQGITLVTPIQAANWVGAIANGGTLNTPHVAKGFMSAGSDEIVPLEFEPIREVGVDSDALETVRFGMRSSVAGERRVIIPLTDAAVPVAAKTGTAEFGALVNGVYEHTHAWTIGFFPYDDPKYSFSIFLEDGGQSNNAAYLMRQFIDWLYAE